MIDPVSPSGDVCVYYNVLEADEHGRVPSDSNFNSQSKSGLQLIAKSGNKVRYLPSSVVIEMQLSISIMFFFIF